MLSLPLMTCKRRQARFHNASLVIMDSIDHQRAKSPGQPWLNFFSCSSSFYASSPCFWVFSLQIFQLPFNSPKTCKWCVQMVVCVSMLQASCPGCNPTFTWRQLGWTPAHSTTQSAGEAVMENAMKMNSVLYPCVPLTNTTESSAKLWLLCANSNVNIRLWVWWCILRDPPEVQGRPLWSWSSSCLATMFPPNVLCPSDWSGGCMCQHWIISLSALWQRFTLM